jgi:hypothetical protein
LGAERGFLGCRKAEILERVAKPSGGHCWRHEVKFSGHFLFEKVKIGRLHLMNAEGVRVQARSFYRGFRSTKDMNKGGA